MDSVRLEQLVQQQADALERIAEELEYQNAVLAELARAQHLTAVASNDFGTPDEQPESAPNTRTLLTMIRDQEHEREVDDRLLADGGDNEASRAELEERVDELEEKMAHIAAHNRRDTAPEGDL